MRLGSGAVVAVTISLALFVSACSSAKPDLLREYLNSTDVENDPYSGEGSKADRLANFASYGSPDQLPAMLLSPFSCDDGSCQDLTVTMRDNMIDATGPDAEIYGRYILVKHSSGRLEMITVYVAREPGKTALLFDSTGESYQDGLDDFRENNDILDSNDWILVPRKITAVSGKNEALTVTGHTTATWHWWLIGAAAAIVVLIAIRRMTYFRRQLTARDRGRPPLWRFRVRQNKTSTRYPRQDVHHQDRHDQGRGP